MVVIRKYIDEDFAKVVALWYRSWTQAFPDLSHPQSYEQWESRFANHYINHDGVWVATLDDRIMGFMVLEDRTIAQIFVDVEAQRQGIGTALINYAKQISPQDLHLTVLIQNRSACQFYQKQGFIAGKQGTNPINGQPNLEYHWWA